VIEMPVCESARMTDQEKNTQEPRLAMRSPQGGDAMLVLTRKVGETVRIAENIEVTVIEIKHGKVRLGFRCPKEVPILRQEVYDREQAHEPHSQIQKLAELVGV
jgi:carbon storage regulator